MTLVQTGLLIVTVILWLALACLRFSRISRSSLSDFEINRRAKSGDRASKQLQRRNRLLPRLAALKTILFILVAAMAVLSTIHLLGVVVGGFVSVGLALVGPLMIHVKPLARTLQRLWDRFEPKFLDVVVSFSWLKWFVQETDQPIKRIASKEELSQAIGRSNSAIGSDQIKRLQSVLRFSDLSIVDFMTPISRVKTISHDETLGPLVLDELHRTGRQHFPVVDQANDEIVGLLYLDSDVELATASSTVKQAMDRTVYFINQDRPLESALRGFLQTARYLFIVVDEQNKTVGVLSLSDTVNALLGEDITEVADQLHLTERKFS